MNGRTLRFVVCLLIVSCVVTACVAKTEKSPQRARTQIKLAQRDWLSFKLTNMMAKILLEEEMGYHVVLVDVEGETQFESLARGETHAILEVWPAAWQDELKAYLQDNALIEYGGE